MAMWGNGAGIGIVARIPQGVWPIIQELHQAGTGCYGAAVGPTTRGIAGRLLGTSTAPRTIGTAMSGSAC